MDCISLHNLFNRSYYFVISDDLSDQVSDDTSGYILEACDIYLLFFQLNILSWGKILSWALDQKPSCSVFDLAESRLNLYQIGFGEADL